MGWSGLENNILLLRQRFPPLPLRRDACHPPGWCHPLVPVSTCSPGQQARHRSEALGENRAEMWPPARGHTCLSRISLDLAWCSEGRSYKDLGFCLAVHHFSRHWETRAVITPETGGQLPGMGRGLLPAKTVIQPSFKPACPTGGTEPGWLRHGIASVKLARAHTIRSACQMWKDKQHSSQHQARVVQTDNTQRNINLASTELSQHCFLNKSEAAE